MIDNMDSNGGMELFLKNETDLRDLSGLSLQELNNDQDEIIDDPDSECLEDLNQNQFEVPSFKTPQRPSGLLGANPNEQGPIFDRKYYNLIKCKLYR